jgi:hypothetical protein
VEATAEEKQHLLSQILKVISSLTEIKVTWENFKFCITIKRYKDLSQGVAMLKQTIHEQCKMVFSLSAGTTPAYPCDTLIRLSEQECNKVCSNGADGNVVQLFSSTHLMVQTGNKITKFIYNTEEKDEKTCDTYNSMYEGYFENVSSNTLFKTTRPACQEYITLLKDVLVEDLMGHPYNLSELASPLDRFSGYLVSSVLTGNVTKLNQAILVH